jgi:hypothetical protein
MASCKRTQIQRERDLEEIARLYLRGTTQVAIAQYLNEHYYLTDPLCQQQISYDLKILRNRWLKSSMVNFNEARARELSKIDQLERTYWEGWERSLQQFTSKTIKGHGALAEGKPSKIEQTTRTEERVGDPSFLAGVERCIAKRCELLGLSETDRLQNDWRSELIQLLKIGKIRPADVLDELGRDLASELFASAGIKAELAEKAGAE